MPIIPISARWPGGRRYFKPCHGHGHTPRAILFRDIILDSSFFLQTDILVEIASNPLRQSVSPIRTPLGLLVPFPFSVPRPSVSYFLFCLVAPLCSFMLSIDFSLHRSLDPPSPRISLYFSTRIRCFSHFTSLYFSSRLFVPFLCSRPHVYMHPVTVTTTPTVALFSTVHPGPR